MAKPLFPRHINFENILNFRDLGGYQAKDGRSIVWRRLFRSAELRQMTQPDRVRLQTEVGLISVMDLRSPMEREKQGIGPVKECGFQYHNIPFMTGEEGKTREPGRFNKYSNMGQVYLDFIGHPEYGQHIVEALEIIARPEKHPLVFHCAVGKDRTGILAALLLSILGVSDETIIEDYTLTGPYMKELKVRLDRDPNLPADAPDLPDFWWEATAGSMELFLSTLKREHGSARQYLQSSGASPELFNQLETVLLA